MTAVRFEITDDRGGVKVEDCALSVQTGDTATSVAREALRGAPAGWRIRLWFDVPFGGSLDDLGDPTVVLTAQVAS